MLAQPPDDLDLARLLDGFAPLRPAPLCPEIAVFYGLDLVEFWEAAERLAGRPVPSPFWAYPWPGGLALARVLLDEPERVRGRRVLDLGTGGGVAAVAAAKAGAREVVANDIDGWAVATARLTAERNGVELIALHADLTAAPKLARDYQVVLCGDLAYQRNDAPRQRLFLDAAHAHGADVLAADAGRAYFDATGLERVASFTLRVPEDLEGVRERTATVWAWGGAGSSTAPGTPAGTTDPCSRR